MRLRYLITCILWATAGCAGHAPASRNPTSVSSQAAANPEREAAKASLSAAIARRDYRSAITIENEWARQHPVDLDFRHLEPALYLLAGDSAGWEHARNDLLQSWRQIRGTAPPPATPSFTVDLITAGRDIIIADQCYERAGRFGVIYRFTVLGPDRQTHSFFTVESPDSDNKIARELGNNQQVFTLDHFRPGMHETVAMLPGLPAYANLRQRVLDYIANPRPLSASSTGQPGLSTEGCLINPVH